jgi:hypothetical protein
VFFSLTVLFRPDRFAMAKKLPLLIQTTIVPQWPRTIPQPGTDDNEIVIVVQNETPLLAYPHQGKILSSLSYSERDRCEDLAEDHIYITARFGDVLELTTAVPSATSSPPTDSVGVLPAGFIHWFNVDLSSTTDPDPRISGFQIILSTSFLASKEIPR